MNIIIQKLDRMSVLLKLLYVKLVLILNKEVEQFVEIVYQMECVLGVIFQLHLSLNTGDQIAKVWIFTIAMYSQRIVKEMIHVLKEIQDFCVKIVISSMIMLKMLSYSVKSVLPMEMFILFY